MISRLFLSLSLLLFFLFLLPQFLTVSAATLGAHTAYGHINPRYCDIASGLPTVFLLSLNSSADDMAKYFDCYKNASRLIIRLKDFNSSTPLSVFQAAAANISGAFSEVSGKTYIVLGNELNNLAVEYSCSQPLAACGNTYAGQFQAFSQALAPAFKLSAAPLDLSNSVYDASQFFSGARNAYSSADFYAANSYELSSCRPGYVAKRCTKDSWQWYQDQLTSKEVVITEFGPDPSLRPSVIEQVDFVSTNNPGSPVTSVTGLILNTCGGVSGQWLIYAAGRVYDERGNEVIPTNCQGQNNTTFVSPKSAGFEPLEYPCNQTTDPEFNPLRPYPGSPCDPLIPRGQPEAVRTPEKNYLAFDCSNNLNSGGTYSFPKGVSLSSLQPYPGDASARPDQLYRCGDDVCVVKRTAFNIELDLSEARLPIIGNTEQSLDDASRTNNYLNWYLNGSVQHSDQNQLDPNSPADTSRLVNFSGPVKKLLSLESQTLIRNTIKIDPPVFSDLHNYKNVSSRLNQALPDIFSQLPLSSLEDTVGEVVVSVEPRLQPAGVVSAPGRSISLRISSADSRLYFPHVKSTLSLAEILRFTQNPYGFDRQFSLSDSLNPEDADFLTQKIDVHQGDEGVQVQTAFNEGNYTGQTRNTEIRENLPAPRPLLDMVGTGLEMCVVDQNKIRINPGDTLFGGTIGAQLDYYQTFRYRPTNTSGCLGDGSLCGQDSDCCTNQCEYQSPTAPVDPSWRNTNRCVGSLGEEKLATQGNVQVTTKSPLIERLYNTIVFNSGSLLRRFMPQSLFNPPDGKDARRTTTTVTYRTQAVPENSLGNNSEPQNTQVTAGTSVSTSGGNSTTQAQLYIPRVGSIFDYFLGACNNESVNLQKTLRPQGFGFNCDFAVTQPSTPPPSTSGGNPLTCTLPLTSCGPINWDDPSIAAYARAYNSNNDDSWSLVNEPWARNLINATSSWACPQFVLTLWLEESGGSAIGAYDLGCIYFFDTAAQAQGSRHRGGPDRFNDYPEFQNFYEPVLRNQLSCLRSYIQNLGNDFRTFMCQYSGEVDTDPAKPNRQCQSFVNNPNFPVNICKIGLDYVGFGSPVPPP